MTPLEKPSPRGDTGNEPVFLPLFVLEGEIGSAKEPKA
jgi:hypothetical protein